MFLLFLIVFILGLRAVVYIAFIGHRPKKITLGFALSQAVIYGLIIWAIVTHWKN